MPTVYREKGYRFFFYSNEHLPIHIHIEKENKTAKYDLIPIVDLVKSNGFNSSELKEIRTIIENNTELLILKWNEYFNN
jgi:hypothetical protein